MKKCLTLFLITGFSFLFTGCDPLDKKYDKDQHEAVLAEHADSASRSAFNRATVENDVNDVRNEEFTYHELIEQGKALQKKEQPPKAVVR